MNRTHALSVGVSLGAVALVLVQLSPLVVALQAWVVANVAVFTL